MKKLFLVIFFWTVQSMATPPPAQPKSVDHPGSDNYSFQVTKETLQVNGRSVELWLPAGAVDRPLIVFGKGMATSASNYEQSFEHLAKKGVVVAFPQYDSGLFDRNWSRMAKDFVDLSQEVVNNYADQINPQQIVFSGHSKGAYVAMMAAGLPEAEQTLEPGAVVIFAPAGRDDKYLQRVNNSTPLTVIFGEKDTIVEESISKDIFAGASSDFKQYIRVSSYPTNPAVAADHMFVLTKGTLLGGGPNGANALHFYGMWKWLLGAAFDLQEGGLRTNPYLYGDKTLTTGVPGLEHSIEKKIR